MSRLGTRSTITAKANGGVPADYFPLLISFQLIDVDSLFGQTGLRLRGMCRFVIRLCDNLIMQASDCNIELRT